MPSAAKRAFLVVYPGESKNRFGQVVGHIYVNDGPEKFDFAGGPPTRHPIGRWMNASGVNGRVTQAWMIFAAKSGQPISVLVASRQARQMFYDQRSGKLMSRWQGNDFGKWSWNLTRDGRRTVFFLHTTPADEAAGASEFDLVQSHGCLHIRPKDRDTMVSKGYLREGTTLIVKPYEERWSPPLAH